MATDADRRVMARALELAARGRCGASPNPMVGAVVLDARGQAAAEGWHRACGHDHAEVVALRESGDRARGGTLYVTLEPCTHVGRTPPCTDAVIASGVRRVVVAGLDPNPTATGGVDRLREAGLEVEVGVLADEADRLNRRFLRWAAEGRPWVTLKAAISLDGRIATRTRESQWITGTGARQRALELREEHDAILVGVGTILADDPRLTRRLGLNPDERLTRVVLDSRLRTPTESTVVREHPGLTVLAHTASAPHERRTALRDAGVRLLEVDRAVDGRVDLQHLLTELAREPVAALLVEGGGEVSGAFFDAGLVDEMVVFLAPLVIGGREAVPVVAGCGAGALAEAARLTFEQVVRRGDDLEIVAVRPEDADVHRVG